MSTQPKEQEVNEFMDVEKEFLRLRGLADHFRTLSDQERIEVAPVFQSLYKLTRSVLRMRVCRAFAFDSYGPYRLFIKNAFGDVDDLPDDHFTQLPELIHDIEKIGNLIKLCQPFFLPLD